MSYLFKRKKKLLSEKNRIKRSIGYARALNFEGDYLKKQMQRLNEYGCNLIFFDILSSYKSDKPKFIEVLKLLKLGDELVITTLDRAFNSKREFLKIINKFLDNGIHLKILSGIQFTGNSRKELQSIFKILYELENLDSDNLEEKKKGYTKNRRIVGGNLGGRPKLSPLKESLVIRLRHEGFSYRSIRSQTGIALSTIRRIIIDSEISQN